MINPNTRIGSNCRIHTSVNISASGGSNISPIIVNNVYIGPGAILFGEIIIGDNITIAANATVNSSIEEKNCTIAGSPAKIVKTSTNTWWEKNGLLLGVSDS